jgi:hypothetical protein
MDGDGMRRSLPLIVLTFVAVMAGTGSAPAADPDCSVYNEPRIFLETQSWWRQTPGATGTDFGHVHVGTCFPYLQDVSASVPFDIQVKLHNNPGRLYQVDVQAFNDAYGVKLLTSTDPAFTCPTGDCTLTYHLDAPTAGLAVDGLTEFRVRATVRTPDGNDFLATDGWLAYVRNGKTAVDTHYLAPNISEARGWYGLPGTDGLGYENARLRSPVPTAPVSGTWSPEVETLPGAGPSSPVTHTLVTIDPAFHDVPPDSGKVQLDQTGAFRGPIAVDTTQLANGPHKLVVVSSADHPDRGSTQSGVMAIPFTVDNLGAEGLDDFGSPLMSPLLLGAGAMHAIADTMARGQQSPSRATGH